MQDRVPEAPCPLSAQCWVCVCMHSGGDWLHVTVGAPPASWAQPAPHEVWWGQMGPGDCSRPCGHAVWSTAWHAGLHHRPGA